MRRARRMFTFTIMSRTVWITAFGFGLIVMSVLLGGAAFNTGTSLLYMMLSMLIALFTLSVVVGWLNLNGLQISRRGPAECHAGEPTELQVIAKNGKRWGGSYGVAVEENVAEIEPEVLSAFFLTVPPRGAVVERRPVTFARRGLYRLEGVRIGTLFPFGLLQFRSRQADPVELIVYPAWAPLSQPPHRLSPGAGEHEHPEKGRGSGLHSIREYAPGDPARDIHWRISAKGGGLKVREYESESAEGVQLVLNIAREEVRTEADRERLENAISQTASLSRYYLKQEIEVMVWTAAGVVPRGTGPVHLKRILRSLALLEVDAMKPHATPPAPPTDMTRILVSGSVTDEVAGTGSIGLHGGAVDVAVGSAGRSL